MSSAAEVQRAYIFKEQSILHNALSREVQEARSQPTVPGEVPWYYLSGTGFFVKTQSDAFFKGLKDREQKGQPFNYSLEKEFSKVKVDIQAFEDEYLKQLAGLKWNIGFKEVAGKKRIVATGEYNDTLLEEITDRSEREGAVYDLWFAGDKSRNIQGVEEWLCNAPKNSLAVIVSPAGWSGLLTHDRKLISFPETQVYVARVDEDGQLAGYTFRSNADIEKNVKLQKRLGLQVDHATSQKEGIKQMVKNVALLSGDNPKNPVKTIDDVVNVIEEVNDSPVAFEGKTFADIRTFLRNPEAFSYRHPQMSHLLADLENFVLRGFSRGRPETEIKVDFQIALALTILKLNKLYREQEENHAVARRHEHIVYDSTSIRQNYYNNNPDMPFYAVKNLNFASEIEDLRKRGGCAGGGSKENKNGNESGRHNSMGSSRRGEISTSSEENYSFDHDGICVVCDEGPKPVGPCEICESCDAKLSS